MKESIAKNILQEVKKNYDDIAEDFSKSRQYNWEEILPLLKKYIKQSEKSDNKKINILDLGCGNGRLIELLKKIEFANQQIKFDYTGIDFSENLINMASQKFPEYRFLTADALNIPFDNNSFDIIITIATLHHIPSYKLRLQFANEIKRTLKKDGIAIITVWNMWNWRNARKSFLKSLISKLFFISNIDLKDIFLSWNKTNKKRYFHLFTLKELISLFLSINFSKLEAGILKSEKGRKNFYLVLLKI